MYPTGAYPLTFQYPGQQPVANVYQSQYGAFTPQGAVPFQQIPPSRGQSLPAPIRQQYPQQNGSTYAPTPSRRNGQYPPPAPSQNYDQQQNYRTGKSKKQQKRRSVSPNGVADQGLYSDKEKSNPKSADGQYRSQSPALGTTRSKQEDTNPNDQEQTSQAIENTNDETSLGGTAPLEEQQGVGEKEKRKSRSKKKRHHRHGHHDQYNNYYQQQQQQSCYGGLPEHLRVHQQPLYNGYSQAYEESLRRDDAYHKQAKHSTRLPPEAKQQLLPHENDQQQQQQQQPPQPQQQPYPYPGYPEQPYPNVPQQPYPNVPQQPYPNVPQPFNPYQPYAPPQQPFFGQALTYNAVQPWSPAGPVSSPADQEIYRLRTHIHTLEGELHKLQKKLNKATLHQQEGSGGQDETNRSQRSKRDGAKSPRQTPVIVELNNTTGDNTRESSSKKNRNRTPSNVSSQQGQSSAPVSSDKGTRPEAPPAVNNAPNPNQQQVNAGNQNVEADNRNGNKNPREETAAQLAHAAAAHVNARQQGPPPPPPPTQQQYLYQPGVLPPQVQQVRGPAPPRQPGPGPVRYPNDPYQQQFQPQQQQQQQFQPQQQQQQFQPQQQQQQQFQPQRNPPNPNYNQSNNNELYSNDEEQQRSRSAEKILDAFERFYMTSGKTSTAPMKVKFIPDEQIQHHHHRHAQLNKNNNNRHGLTSRSSQSSSPSTRSGSDRSSSRHLNPEAACSYEN